MTPLAFDPADAEAFAGRIAGVLESGAIAVMLSVGHRVALFDTLARLPPATATAIAEASGLAERYVREWLAVMVTGRIVTYDPEAGTYHLPAEHAACLTRDAPLGNLALFGQHIALLGLVQEQTIGLLRTGGGTTYGNYPCFHQIMAEDSGLTVTANLFESILPLAPGLIERLETGIDALDAGCGRGSALIAMAERFPKSRFTGYDLCEDAIDFARKSSEHLPNVRFEVRDLTHFDQTASYDFIATFDAVHDQKDPQDFIRRIAEALRLGGVYLMQDIGGSARLEANMDFPMAPMLYAISCAHCTPISIGQGGQGLGTMWGWETADRMLKSAGFTRTERHSLPHDPMNVWFVATV